MILKKINIIIFNDIHRGAFSIVRRVRHIQSSLDFAAKIINTKRLSARGKLLIPNGWSKITCTYTQHYTCTYNNVYIIHVHNIIHVYIIHIHVQCT